MLYGEDFHKVLEPRERRGHPSLVLFLSDGGQEKTHLRGEGSRLRMKRLPRKAEKGCESGTLVTGGGNDQASPPASTALVLPSNTQPKRFLGLSHCGEDIISPDSWASISTNLGGALELHDHRQDREQRTLSCSNTHNLTMFIILGGVRTNLISPLVPLFTGSPRSSRPPSHL